MLISGLKEKKTESIFEKAAAGNVVAIFLRAWKDIYKNFLPPS